MNTQQDHELDASLRERLEKLREVPARNPEAAARGRANYLATARRLSVQSTAGNKGFAAQALPLSPLQRITGWLDSLFRMPGRHQRLSLAVALASMVLTLALLLGGAGATVYAAQSSLPTGILYPVKTLSEDFQLDLTSDPQARFDLLLDFTERRVNEIVALAGQGKTIPDEVVARFETEYDAALLLLVNMDASQMPEVLPKTEDAVARMIRKLDYLQEGHDDPPLRINSKNEVDDVRRRLQNSDVLLKEGMNDPEILQQLINDQLNIDAEPMVSPDLNEEKPGPGECQNCEPVYSGSGPGPGNQGETTQPVETPVPGEGGPGPSNQGDTTQPQDVESYGPGPGPGQMATPTELPVNDNGEVGPSGPPAETPVPGEGGPGPSGEVSPPVPDSGGGGSSSGGGSGKP